MFRTDSIILSRHTIRDGHTFVILFTEEFGKIGCWWRQKKPFPHDVGDIIETIIDRKNSTNHFRHVEPKMAPCEEHWNYKKLSLFLQSLSLMMTLLPEMSTQQSLFLDYKGLLSHMRAGHQLEEHHYLLFRLRILRTLGYIGQESFLGSPLLQYIFREVIQTPLGQLLQSRPLKESDRNTIEQASWEAIHHSTL